MKTVIMLSTTTAIIIFNLTGCVSLAMRVAQEKRGAPMAHHGPKTHEQLLSRDAHLYEVMGQELLRGGAE